jgi:serine phosphatase RsbU (regulator of sigma subunit)
VEIWSERYFLPVSGATKVSGGPEHEARSPDVPDVPDVPPSPPAARDESPPPRHGWPYWLALGVLVLGLVVTGVLVWVSERQYSNNEKRLLDLRVRELGSVLTEALPSIQIPLAGASALADATNGSPTKFTHYASQYVGTGKEFISLSLWRLGSGNTRPLVVVGARPNIAAMPLEAQRFFALAANSHELSIIGLRPPNVTRLGFVFTTPTASGRFITYAETMLPRDRRSTLRSNQAFSDLDYAVYLGDGQQPANLLVTSVAHLPITARHAVTLIPFGNRKLTLVVAARQPLAGTLPERLPWIIAVAGALLSLGAAMLTGRLIQGRRSAEHLAARLEEAVHENQRLYDEQRTIAQTLQHALMPAGLPALDGTETAARFEAGVQGVEIGGDWYDILPLDERRMLVVVGDVSGRGLPAASTMAALRFGIHAYAAQGDSPATVLQKLADLLDVRTSGQFATVLCALVDVEAREVTISSAGHLPPLVLTRDGAEYVEGEVGVPIGVQGEAPYGSTTITVPPGSTLLAYTDGLVERRGEHLDRSLARMREVAAAADGDLDELLDRLLRETRLDVSEDDTAIVGVRWKE